MKTDDTRVFIRHALIALGLVALALLIWHVSYALLLAFGGVLFAVFLRGLAGKLSDWTGLSIGWALLVVGVALVGIAVLTGVLVGPGITQEVGQLSNALTKGVDAVRGAAEQTELGRQISALISHGVQPSGQLLGTAAKLLRGAVDAVLAFIIIFFAGLYFAASPRLYVEGLISLVPPARHARARDVVKTVGNALWLWLIGQFVQMLAVGVLTGLGLWAIGVPLAFALGLIAGLLEFVPFLGPIAAAVPILLVALTVDATTALYAALLMLVIQQAEGNIITPLVQRWAVALPPVLVVISALGFTLLFGVLGAIFATPLLVVALVCTKMLYMQDALGERVSVPGKEPQSTSFKR